MVRTFGAVVLMVVLPLLGWLLLPALVVALAAGFLAAPIVMAIARVWPTLLFREREEEDRADDGPVSIRKLVGPVPVRRRLDGPRSLSPARRPARQPLGRKRLKSM
jgi:hypothetical protein